MLADFTVTDVTTIITAVGGVGVLLIGAIAAGFNAIRNSQRASDTSNNIKLDEIHKLTNSNLTSVTEELANTKKELADLKLLVLGLSKTSTSPVVPFPPQT